MTGGTAVGAAVGAAVLSVRGLTKSYGGRRVLDGLDLDVAAGELVAVLGANGSGKSTALRCVVGLTEPDGGSIQLSGTDLATLRGPRLAEARRAAGMVFQQIHLVHRRTALQNVCAGGLARLRPSQSLVPALFPRDLKEEAMACLDAVGLADRAHDRAGRLSGGQQQRVAIARALCQRPAVLLADEPVSALDPAAAEQVMGTLAGLARDHGLAVAAVLHQPDIARRHADRIVGVLAGRVAVSGLPSTLTAADLDELYAPFDALPEGSRAAPLEDGPRPAGRESHPTGGHRQPQPNREPTELRPDREQPRPDRDQARQLSSGEPT